MEAKYVNPAYLYQGIVTKGIDAREADQFNGEVSFTCDGQSEVAVFDVDSCLRVFKNIDNSISRVVVPVGSLVSFRIKSHLENFLKAHELQIL